MMDEEARTMEATDISEMPELVRLAEEVRHTNQPKSLRVGNEEVGVLRPPRPRKPSARRRRTGCLREDDTFWNIVGMVTAEDGPTDVSSNKHHYLAEAYLPKDQ